MRRACAGAPHRGFAITTLLLACTRCKHHMCKRGCKLADCQTSSGATSVRKHAFFWCHRRRWAYQAAALLQQKLDGRCRALAHLRVIQLLRDRLQVCSNAAEKAVGHDELAHADQLCNLIESQRSRRIIVHDAQQQLQARHLFAREANACPCSTYGAILTLLNRWDGCGAQKSFPCEDDEAMQPDRRCAIVHAHNGWQMGSLLVFVSLNLQELSIVYTCPRST